jgi:acyl-CoA thioester hydrolase
VALNELWRDRVGAYHEMVDAGYDLVVAEATIRFKSSARFDELLDISVSVQHLGTTSMIVHPEFRVGDRLVADGEIRHVFVDPSSLVKKAMPEDIRAALTGSA